MDQTSWLPNLITEDKDDHLVQLVLHSLNHDKKMIRAFAVSLLENNADEEAAREINDILIAAGYTDEGSNKANTSMGLMQRLQDLIDQAEGTALQEQPHRTHSSTDQPKTNRLTLTDYPNLDQGGVQKWVGGKRPGWTDWCRLKEDCEGS